jgi:hypothetical protein
MTVGHSRISFRQVDHQTDPGWFALALQKLGDTAIHAWCDDESQSGKKGLLIADDLQRNAITDYLTRWPRGRLFTAVADLRWERLDASRSHVVLIADGDEHQQLGMEGMLDLTAMGRERHLLLWGECGNETVSQLSIRAAPAALGRIPQSGLARRAHPRPGELSAGHLERPACDPQGAVLQRTLAGFTTNHAIAIHGCRTRGCALSCL